MPNDDLRHFGISYNASCQFKHEGLSKQWLPTSLTESHMHTQTLVCQHCCWQHKYRKYVFIMETKQETNPEIAWRTQKGTSIFWCKSHLHSSNHKQKLTSILNKCFNFILAVEDNLTSTIDARSMACSTLVTYWIRGGRNATRREEEKVESVPKNDGRQKDNNNLWSIHLLLSPV